LLLLSKGKSIFCQQGGKRCIHAGIIPIAFLENAQIP
jgi:hypothetical protein